MTEKLIEIKMSEDLDARPIAMLVQIASRHESSIYLMAEGKKVNARRDYGDDESEPFRRGGGYDLHRGRR